jgi:hypothetical protein
MVCAALALMGSSINASNSCMRSSNTKSSEEEVEVEEAAEGRGSGSGSLSESATRDALIGSLQPIVALPAKCCLAKFQVDVIVISLVASSSEQLPNFSQRRRLSHEGRSLEELEGELLHVLLVYLPSSVFTYVPFEPSTVLPSTPHTHRKVICIHYSLLRSGAARLDDGD